MVKKKIVIDRFGGIDEHSTSLSEAVEMVNLQVTKERKLKKRGGLKKVISLRGEEILASWEGTISGFECILFVTKGGFYKYLLGVDAAVYIRPFTGTRATTFEFSERVYILSDVDLYSFDGGAVTRVEGYSPVVAISTDSQGKCELYEAVNMLTPRRRQRFSTDGSNKVLRLLEKDIDEIVSVSYLGSILDKSTYSFNATNATITLTSAYDAGENTIEVEYKGKSDSRNEILRCERAAVFGGGNDTRVFLYGDPKLPSYRRHSELGSGLPRADYFPENNYVSLSGKVITSIIRHYDRQLIFTLDSTFYSVDELMQDSLGNFYHSYPVYALNSEKGHIGANDAKLIANEPISVTYDGIYRWVSTSVRDERNALKLSANIERTFLRFLGRRDEYPIRLYDDDIRSELWVVSGDESLIYNYELGVWYFYSGIEFRTFSRCFDMLLLGCENGDICIFDETDEDVPVLFVSGRNELGDPLTVKELSLAQVGMASKCGVCVDLEFDTDTNVVGDGKIKLEIPEGNSTDTKVFKCRFVHKRFREMAFILAGSAKDIDISFISFTFRERSNLF